VRDSLKKHLNRAKVAIMATALIHHIETMVVEVELTFVTTLKDGSSIKASIADRGASFLLKTELI